MRRMLLILIISALLLIVLQGCASESAPKIPFPPPTITIQPTVTITAPPTTVTVAPLPAPTPKPFPSLPPASISIPVTTPTLTPIDILTQFLRANYGTCQTSLGPTNFTFTIDENDSIHRPYDYWIMVEYDFAFFVDLRLSNKITTEMNQRVSEELKNHQENLARAVINLMPDKKFYGGYHYSWYTYPNLRIDLNVRRYYSWTNYEEAKGPIKTRYQDTKVSDFRWHPLIDDELTR